MLAPNAQMTFFPWKEPKDQFSMAGTLFADVLEGERADMKRSRVRRFTGAPKFRGLSCELPVGMFEFLCSEVVPAFKRYPRCSVSSWTPSVRAHGPRPKARSTRPASPRLSCVRLKVAAWPLRNARIILKPLIVA